MSGPRSPQASWNAGKWTEGVKVRQPRNWFDDEKSCIVWTLRVPTTLNR